MANISHLEKTLPTAPLKIAVLESCKELGQKVNDYIVSFRHSATEEYPELAEKISLDLPDETFRRVGQSVAAASLPYCE